ncbi:MAG: YbbR-like domain-containing protein [Deltaproteobacteria bacterium]|jgi:YbbR domain-containing protein|nr:YbbR-like domain-containing protein [Deltaproteobacteria bacterium]
MRAYQIRYGLLALAISAALWGMSHGSSKIERGFDIPVAFVGMPEELVITRKSTQEINIRVLGPRAALRDISSKDIEYAVNLEGAKPGNAVYLVDETTLVMPQGARILSRSPATIELKFERKSRKSVRVTADLEGEPAEGFVFTEVGIDPPRVWLEGARSKVLRLSEVMTETIDVAGLSAPLEREVRLSLGVDHIWVEDDKPVKLRIQVDPIPDLVAEEGVGNE